MKRTHKLFANNSEPSVSLQKSVDNSLQTDTSQKPDQFEESTNKTET